MLHEEKQSLRNIILSHFQQANDMRSLLLLPEIRGRDLQRVKKVVYALENSGMLFGSGQTSARLYQTTKDGLRLLNGEQRGDRQLSKTVS